MVSGLPNRNGDRHVEEIAKMSFGFMATAAKFRIDNLPNERVKLRIGFHTGKYLKLSFHPNKIEVKRALTSKKITKNWV